MPASRPWFGAPVRRRRAPLVAAGIALLVSLAAVPALAASPTEYTIQPGDTLIAVGDSLGVTVRQLQAANDLSDGAVLRVGQVLKVPPSDNARAEPASRGGRPAEPARPSPGGFAWPLRGIITTSFREPGPYWVQGYHTGLDVAAPMGSPIRASADGLVVEAESSGQNGGYGSYVKIDHGGGLISIYGHMAAVRASVGDRVTVASVIGTVGMTGNTTGPHVHWEIRQDGAIRDPLGYLP